MALLQRRLAEAEVPGLGQSVIDVVLCDGLAWRGQQSQNIKHQQAMPQAAC